MDVKTAEKIVSGMELLGERDGRRLRTLEGNHWWDVYLTAKCVTSFWHFLWYGAYWEARHEYYPGLHRRMADFLQDWRVDDGFGQLVPVNLKFLIASRELCKTQMGLLWGVWRCVRDTNTRGLIRAWTAPKAEEIMLTMRSVFESPRFQQRFPWVRPSRRGGTVNAEMWGKDGLKLQRSVLVRTPSIEAVGHEKDPTGGHFHWQLCDDFAVDKSENSDVVRPQLYERFQNDESLMLAGGQRLIVGTTWRKDGFLDSAVKGTGIFSDMKYGLFYQPCVDAVFEKPYSGKHARILEDRLTVVIEDEDVQFPTGADDLSRCQARLTFVSPEGLDTVVELREVLGNERRSFRVNRPFPPVLDQPRSWFVGNEKPAAPNRFTLDAVDLDDAEFGIQRSSLERKRSFQGSYVFGCQYRLRPIDPDSLLFNESDLRYIARKDLPVSEGVWYRKCDLSSSKETGGYTAILEGLVTDKAIYLTHLFWGLPDPLEIMLELFRGVLRLEQQYEAAFRHTHFEKAHIEQTIGKLLPMAMRDPYSFFKQARGEYARFADTWLSERGAVNFPIVHGARKGAKKIDRIRALLQPTLEQRRIIVLEDMPHSDRLQKEIGEATLRSEEGIDVLDVLSDMCVELRPKTRQMRQDGTTGDMYGDVNQEAAFRGLVGTSSGLRWPPR